MTSHLTILAGWTGVSILMGAVWVLTGKLIDWISPERPTTEPYDQESEAPYANH